MHILKLSVEKFIIFANYDYYGSNLKLKINLFREEKKKFNNDSHFLLTS